MLGLDEHRGLGKLGHDAIPLDRIMI